jgi:hypothetical protein
MPQMRSIIPILACNLAAAALVNVDIDTASVSHTVDERFLSFSYDASQLRGEDPFGFFNSSRITAMLAGLAPAFFRFSGTAIDAMVFDEDGQCPNDGGDLCINATQLTNLVAVTSASNTSLILGLNGRLGKTANAPDAPWNSTNAAAEFSFLAQLLASDPSLVAPYGFELGNEPDLWRPSTVNGSQLALDVTAFRALVKQLLPPPAGGDVVTFGPDTCNCFHGDTVLEQFASTFDPTTPGNAKHSLTFHFYNMGGAITPQDMVNVSKADNVLTGVTNARSMIANSGNAAALDLPLVIGETGECVNGGCMGPPEVGGGPQPALYSESFIDSFLSLDKFGLTAALNVSVIMKEKIFGGNDGVIDAIDFPGGSYWVMLLHKQLVGPGVLNVSGSTAPGRDVRLYAQCARQIAPGALRLVPEYPAGAFVLMAINLNTTETAQLSLTGIASAPRDEYWLSGGMPSPLPNNDTNCAFGPQQHKLPYLPSAVCLNNQIPGFNGQLLYLGDGPLGSNTTLPQLQPHTVTDTTQTLTLAPLSLGFFVFPSANLPACLSQGR